MLASRLSRVLLNNSSLKNIRSTQVFKRFAKVNKKDSFDPKEYQLSLTGSRETVGYGMNGQPMYVDNPSFPFPSIRYMEPTPDIQALRGKERGDWRLLTIDEKKKLYRASFCQTYAEFMAPTGEWKFTLAWTTILVCIGVWMYILHVIFVYDKYPESFSEESRMAQMRRQIDLHINPIEGIASEWDYEKKDWKKHGWFTPPNPFIDPCTGELMEDVEYS